MEEPSPLEAVFSRGAAFHLRETSPSADQNMAPLDDERAILRATVENTSEMRRWLLGFGANVEVIAPLALRDEFREIIVTMARLYGQINSSLS